MLIVNVKTAHLDRTIEVCGRVIVCSEHLMPNHR